jgi:ribosomal protein S18 acetylase RimI-like enzyme
MKISEYEISNDLNFIDDVLELHNRVFDEGRETIYNSKEEWLRRIADGGYFVFCKKDSVVVGYAVCDIVENGDFKIWLVGVDSGFRKQGIWSMLYENVKNHAQSEGRTHMLLNTFPSKFPAMYSFLRSVNAEIYKKEMVDGSEKFYVKIPI